MRGFRGLVTAALLAASPFLVAAQAAPAPAPTDVIATLNTVCVAAGGDPARAAALAAEAGYSPVPETMVPRLRNASERAGFMRSNATDITFVMTGRMTRRVGRDTVVMDFCGVSARPTDHRALDATLQRMMGFAPVRAAGLEAYAWLQTPEGRAPSRSLSDAQFVAMAGTGQMRLVALDRSGPGSTLIYFRPRLD
ncbi:hypothetical protein KOAAANKH_00353 [Brevundimonas sp. NIBR10]|uniref:hypothetical protein n=1 Tax=Brevundimonas sp. NIBR10 TaxID=3015997 RepID=UPI0022F14AB8|nr:hypothetical protein [Brevundimonas sp. NIBR10]WGM45490.1 hypothetical protein KOAAANKH_00353 [Brevundimonas sp. NIBR10]